jgi:hypothetical protein
MCEQHKLGQEECMYFYLHASICLRCVFKYQDNSIFCFNIITDHNSFTHDEYLETCYEKISIQNSHKIFKAHADKYNTILVTMWHEL